MTNPPSPTQCPQITSLDDVVADQYDAPEVVTGAVMTYDSDGCVPAEFATNYIIAQQMAASTSGTMVGQQFKAQLSNLIAVLRQYEFRLIDRSSWRKVLDIRLPSGTSTPLTNESVSIGASNTEAYMFGVELGIRVWAEAEGGVIFAKAKAGLEVSAKISASLSESYTWTDTTTTTVGAPGFTAKEDCRVLVWQKIANIDLEVRNVSLGTDWTRSSTFSDRNNTFANQVFPAAAAQGAQLAVRQGPVAKPKRPAPRPQPAMTHEEALRHLAALKAQLEQASRAA